MFTPSYKYTCNVNDLLFPWGYREISKDFSYWVSTSRTLLHGSEPAASNAFMSCVKWLLRVLTGFHMDYILWELNKMNVSALSTSKVSIPIECFLELPQL